MLRTIFEFNRLAKLFISKQKKSRTLRSRRSHEQRLGDGDLFEVTPEGCKRAVFIRPQTTDINVYQDVFLDNAYKIPLPFTPQNIVDCGANTGFSAIYFALMYPGAKIVANALIPSQFFARIRWLNLCND